MPAAPSAQRSVAAAAPAVVIVVLVLALDAQHLGVVDDVAGDEGEDRVDSLELLVRDVEVVLVEHDEVRELADFDGAEVLLFAEEPAVAPGIEVERVETADPLIGQG